MQSSRIRNTALAVTMVLAGGAVPLLAATPAAHAAGTTYYVNCTGGSTGNGSATNPWTNISQVNARTFAAGDTLLFARGSTCNGTSGQPATFAPRGSGTATAPIKVGAYGTGEAPVISGSGLDSAVLLKNVQGWELRDLTITNPTTNPGGQKGIFVFLDNGFSGTVANHFVFENLTIRNVDGVWANNYNGKRYVLENATGGVIIRNNKADGLTRFADVQVRNNTFTDIGGMGVETWNSNCRRPGQWWNTTTQCLANYAASTGVVVANNSFTRLGAGAVTPFITDGAQMLNNVVTDWGNSPYTGSAAFWTTSADNALIQGNSVSYGNAGGDYANDANAYDIDNDSHNVTVQYNYSYRNDGGAWMYCGSGSNANFRYNVSIQDYNRTIRFCPGSFTDSAVYNNTVIIDRTGSPFSQNIRFLTDEGASTPIAFRNNVITNRNGTVDTVYRASGAPAATFDTNLFQNVTPPSGSTNSIVADPRFVDPATTTPPGIKLRTGSPALDAGKVIINNGGRDYFGNPVAATGAPNLGAYEGPGL
ncbi:hypothetical protein CGZ95_12725 [Enemella evansiae]|uniref:hypothetical protein n=1 Tax=Enemella evansiae TaxID=2016499 RepID=UPI000B96441F|nr:hypothetical protein [Enemella evansiae]OYN98073.1 hypothetical protein CGZ95_12725 [Enemella evansiae]